MKKIILVLMSITMLLSLSACGGSGSGCRPAGGGPSGYHG